MKKRIGKSFVDAKRRVTETRLAHERALRAYEKWVQREVKEVYGVEKLKTLIRVRRMRGKK